MTRVTVGYVGATLEVPELIKRKTWAMLDPEFARRVLALIQASPVSNGAYSLGFGEGWRDSSAQAAEFVRRHHVDPRGSIRFDGQLWTLNPGTAPLAPPGSSYHESTTREGKALAADLVGNLTWAAANNARFGLRDFRNVGKPVEPWHHQPIEIPTARRDYRDHALVAAVPEQVPPTPQPVAPKPRPDLRGTMRNAIFRCVEDGATFVGIVNDQGAALDVRWSGPGTTDVFRWLDAHRAAGAVDIEVARADLANCSLIGPVPPGWSVADFAPPCRVAAG